MLLALGLTLVLYASLQAEENSFTINSIHMESLPSWEVMNGQQLTLECLVDISTTSKSRSQHRVLFYKDDAMVYNVTSREHTESYVIPQARVFHSGKYKCTVMLNNKEKTTIEYEVKVHGVSKASSIMVNITELFPKPKLEFSSSRLDQGELLDLSCSVSGTPVANFTIQKEETVLSQYQNFSKIAEESDSGEYSCTAGIGKVVKRSGLVPIQVCEMLSKPSIFHDAKSEIIKGHAIGISCQSENGTAPITYHLMKAKSDFQTLEVTSNDPATFTDKPTRDMEYQCRADNCHSHPAVFSEILRVRVIAPVDEVVISILSSNEVQSGSEMVLRCSVKEGTSPITFQFYKEKEDRPFHQAVVNDTQAFWHNKQASKKQEGQYYCTASNRASSMRTSPRSSTLAVRVFLAPWKKGLIAVVVIGVVIATLIVAAKCYFLRKAKAKQKPVEMSRPAAPLLNSNSEKISEPSVEANSHYGYDDVSGNDAVKPINQNKDPQNMDVEYTEVEVSSLEPHQENGRLP